MSIPLFKRRATVIVGNLTFSCGQNRDGVTGLDIDFEIEKSLRATPNKCTLRVYNLTETHRAELAQLRRDQRHNALVLQAGYEEDDFVIFAGDVIECATERVGPDYVTTFLAGDGHRARRTARVSEPVAEGTNVQQLVQQIARPVGRLLGATDEQTNALVARVIPSSTAFQGGSQAVRGSSVVSGNAMSELERVSRSAGYEVSIQDGALQFIRSGSSTTGVAIRLASDSGLIKAPIRKSNGIVEARTLIIPDLLPGRRVQFDGENVQGAYRVVKSKYTGATAGTDWFVDLECREL